MKSNKLFKSLSVIFLFLILVSCETKKSEIKSASPDGSVKITIAGQQRGMDPWKLTITVEADGKQTQVETEMYADELNAENIKFKWQDNRNCDITLVERDGVTRTVPVRL